MTAQDKGSRHRTEVAEFRDASFRVCYQARRLADAAAAVRGTRWQIPAPAVVDLAAAVETLQALLVEARTRVRPPPAERRDRALRGGSRT